MARTRPIRPVLVGVDGSKAALRACQYASWEATQLGSGVRVMHVYRPHAQGLTDESFVTAMKDDGYRILREAAQSLRRHTDMPVDVALEAGRPSQVLAEASRNASVVVVGRRPFPEGVQPAPSNLVLALTPAAACPVVVVPVHETPWEQRNLIIVGVADVRLSQEALRFAFAEAARRKGRVTLVRAWRTDGPEGHGPWFMRDREANEVLDDAVAELSAAYPEVAIERVVESGRPVDVLLRHAADAGLLVVGTVSHDLDDLDDLDDVGEVARELVATADVPVAVVRHRSRPGRPEATASTDSQARSPAGR